MTSSMPAAFAFSAIKVPTALAASALVVLLSFASSDDAAASVRPVRSSITCA